ncbi:unnamed protein product, partial [Adineta steineri]
LPRPPPAVLLRAAAVPQVALPRPLLPVLLHQPQHQQQKQQQQRRQLLYHQHTTVQERV